MLDSPKGAGSLKPISGTGSSRHAFQKKLKKHDGSDQLTLQIPPEENMHYT